MAAALAVAILWISEGPTSSGVGQAATPPWPATPGALGAALVGIAVLMLLNAILIAAEAALELLRPGHVRHIRETNERRADRLQALIDARARHLAACSLGSHIIRLVIAFVTFCCVAPWVQAWGIERFGWADDAASFFWSFALAMAPIGFIHLIFGELLPKSYAVLHPHRLASVLSTPIVLASALLSPFAMALTAIAGLITSRFGGKASFSIPNQAEEEILNLVEEAQEQGEIESEERELLRSVFDFTDTVAREVMTPRVDLDALPVRTDPMEVVRLIQESGHSRIPLFEETDDQIVGIIHAKDLLLAMLGGKAPNLRSLMRPALFVPENKNLYDLITEMRQQRTQLAIVQDEFGGTAGIVTVEDIVEELVGEIVDEYDVEEPEIQPCEEGGWLIDGKTHVDDVSDAIGIELSSDEFDTLGGYVFGLFGRQPQLGEEIEEAGVRFLVDQTDGRRISRLRVQLAASDEHPDAVAEEAV